MQQVLISEVDRLITRLENLHRRSQPALDQLSHRHNGDRLGVMAKHPPGRVRPASPCYRQKTFWVGITLVGTGMFELSQGENSGASVAHVAEGLGLITLRNAIAELGRFA